MDLGARDLDAFPSAGSRGTWRHGHAETVPGWAVGSSHPPVPG